MLFNRYQVEVEDPTTGIWVPDRCFQPVFKWTYLPRKFLRFFWRKRPVAIGDPEVVAIILKADAYHYARRLHRTQTNRHVRITRVEQEGAGLLKMVVWQDGEWC
jgi:hypothetical protein